MDINANVMLCKSFRIKITFHKGIYLTIWIALGRTEGTACNGSDGGSVCRPRWLPPQGCKYRNEV
jgi:hypothetical protein